MLALIVLLGAAVRQNVVAGEVYKIDPAPSAIEFRVKQFLRNGEREIHAV